MPYRGDVGYPREAGGPHGLGSRAFDMPTANTAYCGVAPAGAHEDAPVWRITRLTFDDAGRLSTRLIATGVRWSARATAGYA